MQETLQRVRAGDSDPECELCGGIVLVGNLSELLPRISGQPS